MSDYKRDCPHGDNYRKIMTFPAVELLACIDSDMSAGQRNQHINAAIEQIGDRAASDRRVAKLTAKIIKYFRALDGTRSTADPDEQAEWGVGVDQFERELRALLKDPTFRVQPR